MIKTKTSRKERLDEIMGPYSAREIFLYFLAELLDGPEYPQSERSDPARTAP